MQNEVANTHKTDIEGQVFRLCEDFPYMNFDSEWHVTVGNSDVSDSVYYTYHYGRWFIGFMLIFY